jgi:hypothetical protein
MTELEELKQQAKELLARIEKLETPEIWEPKGGHYYVTNNGRVYMTDSRSSCRSFGVVRETQEQAERARDRMREFNRLLAYVDEHAPEYKFIPGGDNWYVYYNDSLKEWGKFPSDDYSQLACVTMPRAVAEALCEKLESGEVRL